MSIYQKFCNETFDESGRLAKFELNCPDDFNFGYDVVDAIADETPQKRALVWCNAEGDERVFSFDEIRRLSNRAANVFSAAGVGRGDRVLVVLKRHYEYWICTVALHKLGAVLIPATHMLTADDLRYRIARADVKTVVCTPDDGVPERVLQAAQGRAMLLWTVRRPEPGFRFLNGELERAPEAWTRRGTRSTDLMAIYFTSGTTGEPKGVMHDFAYPLAHIVTAKYWQQAEDGGLHFTVAETGWAKASWGKIYGQWLVGCAVMVYDFDLFDPRRLVEIINRYGVTSFCAPPTVYRYLVRKGIPPMPTLRHAATAGEALAPEVFRKFTELTGLPLAEGYGQTETALLTANFAGGEPVPGSLGVPSPMYNIELRRRDGSPADEGEIGEIVVAAPDGARPAGVLAGYLDDEAQYRQVWRDGVYHTGDAAWRDEHGCLWFHGRFDDIIKTGGFRVGPSEVEDVLAKHPAVLECSVIGVPDPVRGQAIKAVVRLASGFAPGKALETELRDFCNARLADYKWVRMVEFVDELPKTISGKIRRTELRKAAAD